MRVGLIAGLCTVSLAISNAFYIPGVAPKEYGDGEDVEIKVSEVLQFLGEPPDCNNIL